MLLLLRGNPLPLLGPCQGTLSSNSHSTGHTYSTTDGMLWMDEMDKPFSQEARKILSSLSGESPKQKHRHTNMLGKGIGEELGIFF